MCAINDPSSCVVTTSFEGASAVLALHGRVEGLAAFDLWEALEGAIDLHCKAVVLDLSELDRIGAAGLVALANAEKSCTAAGVGLTIRTPSRLVRRLLDAMALTKVAPPDQMLEDPRRLARERAGESSHHSRHSILQGSTLRPIPLWLMELGGLSSNWPRPPRSSPKGSAIPRIRE